MSLVGLSDLSLYLPYYLVDGFAKVVNSVLSQSLVQSLAIVSLPLVEIFFAQSRDEVLFQHVLKVLLLQRT